jgi:hypothetical protein
VGFTISIICIDEPSIVGIKPARKGDTNHGVVMEYK